MEKNSFSSWLCHGDAGGKERVLYPDHLSAKAPFAGLQTYI